MKMSDNKWLRNSFVWIIIMAAMLLLFFVFMRQSPNPQDIPISQVVKGEVGPWRDRATAARPDSGGAPRTL